MYIKDTITAIATAPGKGGVGIVRISGPKALEIGQKITQLSLMPRHAHYTDFKTQSDEVIDQGIALYFKAPFSFTGEEIVEFQGHGGPVILDLLLKEVIKNGARVARAGEFSERAFLNDKLDLAQAEAIADLIDASSEQAARSAIRSLQGVFSNKIHDLVEKLIHLRIHVEAAIDFPEEEIDFLADQAIQNQYDEIHHALNEVMIACQQGSILREGITIVIAGKPNAGKSSLLNALAGKDSAIVTDIAGTTRDLLKEYIQIEGVPLHIIDTAGLRISQDIIENEGVKRAFEAITQADHILLVADITDPASKNMHALEPEYFQRLPQNIPITYIHNKIDQFEQDPKQLINTDKDIYISAKTNLGMDTLKQHILKSVGFTNTTEGLFTARTRHIDALNLASDHLEQARAHLENRIGELLAEELKLAQNALSEITGEFKADDLLGRIFSSFCIGK